MFYLKENVQYVIRDDGINIVDAENTGEIRMKTRWSNGLHEFLEMKHKLVIKQEGLVKIYQSNHKLFSQYGENILGLTGTLGSPVCRKFL